MVSNEEFDEMADDFYQEFGYLPFGKDSAFGVDKCKDVNTVLGDFTRFYFDMWLKKKEDAETVSKRYIKLLEAISVLHGNTEMIGCDCEYCNDFRKLSKGRTNE